MKYSKSFTHDLELGEVAETCLNDIFKDHSKIEVKTDFIAHKTGNLFVEIYSRGKKSGLSTTTANYWIFKIDALDISFIISTEKLKELIRHYHNLNGYKQGGDNNTSFGVLIPLKAFIQ